MELSIEEIRKLQLEALLYIKDICKKYDIKFFLTGGTLLGAIKYKGYIPWDDDIDIGLLRDDYKRLIDILIKQENDTYKVLSIYNCKDYYYPFAKLVNKKTRLVEGGKGIKDLGVYIDIFYLADVPDDFEKYYRSFHIIRNLTDKRMRIKSNAQNSNVRFKRIKDAIYGVVDVISLPLGYNFWAKLLDRRMNSYKAENTTFVAPVYGGNKVFKLRKDKVSDLVEAIFENNTFYISRNYDEYLTRVYGNYMEDIPAERKKHPHQSQAFWR